MKEEIRKPYITNFINCGLDAMKIPKRVFSYTLEPIRAQRKNDH